MKTTDLRHIIEFLSPATLAGMHNDMEDQDTPTPQQRQVMALVRDVLVANVGERGADEMVKAIHEMM